MILPLLLSLGCAMKADPQPPVAREAAQAQLSETEPSVARTEASAGVDHPGVAALLEAHWAERLARHPLDATALGDHSRDDVLPDLSLAARQAARSRDRELRERARALLALELSERDRTTVEMLLEQLDAAIHTERCRLDEWAVSARTTPLVTLNHLPELNPLEHAEQGQALIARVAALPTLIDQRIAALDRGLDDGWVADAEAIRRALTQLEEQLAQPVESWPVARAAPESWPQADRQAYGQALRQELTARVLPALHRYGDFLEHQLLPAARSGKHIGLSGLPDDGSCYRALIRQYTSLPLAPEEVHERGRQELDRIHREMRALAPELFGAEDLRAVFARLRSDPELYFSTEEQVEAYAREQLDAALAEVPDWFGRLPRTPVEVRRIPPHEAPYTYVAYYSPPHADGTKPGEYYINTWAPETRPRYEAAALAFHESVPGHHFQIALGQELGELPAFRRHGQVTVFVEGWALYSERLADEMSLYPTELDRFGMLSYQSWRAARLVVDTGLHHLGWSREEAERFMLEHTPLQPNNIANEVDRYVGWPGQALGYMIGQLEIQRLRREAEAALGPDFDLPGFHDALLGGGAVPVPVLERRIERWIAEQSG